MLEIAGKYEKSKISGFENNLKNKKNFPKPSLEVRFLDCCLKHADIPRGRPPLGILHTLATEKFEFRVMALERDFFGLFGNLLKARNLGFFVFLTMVKILKIQLQRFFKNAYGLEAMPIL